METKENRNLHEKSKNNACSVKVEKVCCFSNIDKTIKLIKKKNNGLGIPVACQDRHTQCCTTLEPCLEVPIHHLAAGRLPWPAMQ